jgi:hypothetical protein
MSRQCGILNISQSYKSARADTTIDLHFVLVNFTRECTKDALQDKKTLSVIRDSNGKVTSNVYLNTNVNINEQVSVEVTLYTVLGKHTVRISAHIQTFLSYVILLLFSVPLGKYRVNIQISLLQFPSKSLSFVKVSTLTICPCAKLITHYTIKMYGRVVRSVSLLIRQASRFMGE